MAEIDLVAQTQECAKFMEIALNGRMEEGKNMAKPLIEKGFYYSHCYSSLMSIDAGLSFDTPAIEAAIAALKVTREACNKYRRKTKKSQHENYTDVELHAELCYAETMFFKTGLNFFVNENWSSFIKGGLKVRAFYNSYRECYMVIKSRKWENSVLDKHFFSGVHFGVGAFYMLMSLLPRKVMSLFKMIGVKPSLKIALEELLKGYEMKGSIRSTFCSYAYLAYSLFLHYLVDVTDCNLTQVNAVMDELKSRMPNGTLTKLFNANLEMRTGRIESAITAYGETAAAASERGWRQVQYTCYWYQMMSHGYLCNWRSGIELADGLLQENQFSKATGAYFKASYMLMEKSNLTSADFDVVQNLMKQIPDWNRKVAGRLPPIEKFVKKKSKRFLENNDLPIPGVELMYLWNSLQVIIKQGSAMEKFLTLAERELVQVEIKRENNKLYWDDRGIVLLVKAACLRLLGKAGAAKELLIQVCDSEKKVKKDKYVIPYAQYELGLTYWDLGAGEDAIRALEKARTKYKDFLLESRLQKRSLAALRDIKKKMGADEEEGESDDNVMPEMPDDDA